MKKLLVGISICALLLPALFVPLALADPAHCKVTGGGWFIPTGGTEKATFGFNAMGYTPDQTPYPPEVKGQLEFIDRNAPEIKVHGDVNLWVNVYPDPYLKDQLASFAGSCKVNGEDGFYFLVNVRDAGEPGTSDTFHIRVYTDLSMSNLIYDSGVQVIIDANGQGGIILEGGNIQTHPLPPPMNPEV